MDESRLSRFRKWFANTFVFFGPGLLLAITAAGEAGITEAIEIGAHFGLALLWVVIITLLFKYAFTNGIARYTLATGQTIFDVLPKLPGPKNWGPVLVIVSYCLEMFAIGAMVLFAATFLDYLIPGVFSIFLLSITLLVAALALLRTHIYHKFEQIMAVIVLVMGISMIIVLSAFPFTFEMIASGLIPNIPTGSETAILAILGVVGSGLNLMLYSVWLKEKTDKKELEGEGCYVRNEAFFKKFIKSVNFDIALGFAIVALVTFGFMCLGYAGFAVSFMPHGVELNLNILITQVLYLFSSIPFGTYLFLLFVAVIFFGSVVVGIDARAKALTRVVISMRENAGKTKIKSGRVYQFFIWLFVAIILLSIGINQPMAVIRTSAVLCALLFGVFGFILIYVNTRLPEYARASRLWMLVIGIGSVLSVYVALLIEGSFLEFGLPLFESVLVCSVIFYIFCRTKTFERMASGTSNIVDKFWVIFIFGIISVYGTYSGITIAGEYGSYILNFRDLGAMVAGVLGGPVVGFFAALIGGLYRLSVGGVTAVPCFLATIAAGILAGYAVRSWKGKFTMRRAVYIAAVVELLHLLVIFPIYVLATGSMTFVMIQDVIVTTLLPMTIVNAAGLMIFAHFSQKFPLLESGLKKMTPKSIADEIRSLISHEEDAK
ncbi:MAG: histidine kinase [Methanocorpusculum parvum]|nr:histidine kinase [Methanocorpusculum parvum]